MRGLAAIAAQQGYSQERLATDFSRRADRAITGANVARHFASKDPKPETVEAYCDVLGISGDARAAISGAIPSPAQIEKWRETLRFWFYSHAAEFRDGSLARIESAFDLLDDEQRARGLAAFAFAMRHGSALGKIADGEQFASLANTLAPVLNLRELVHETFPGEGALWDVYLGLRANFDHDTSMALTGVVAAAIPLRFTEADDAILQMWRHLERELSGTAGLLASARKRNEEGKA